jgi:hypothetical protein
MIKTGFIKKKEIEEKRIRKNKTYGDKYKNEENEENNQIEKNLIELKEDLEDEDKEKKEEIINLQSKTVLPEKS